MFGNSVAVARFTGRARELRFESLARVDHRPIDPATSAWSHTPRPIRFPTATDEMPDLARSIERHYPDPEHAVDRWTCRMMRQDGPTGTFELLGAMTGAIKQDLTYIPRHERVSRSRPKR